MARFYGKVGYGDSVEKPKGSGTWVDEMIEASYFGDVIRSASQLKSGEGLNNDLIVGNSISIVADQYAIDNFYNIRYVEWYGALWTVTQVEVRSPRLILSLGSVYNGPVACSTP
jgi:hypothetical protein